jgi:hypothetical protein
MIICKKITLTAASPEGKIEFRNHEFSGQLTNIVIGPDRIDLLVPRISIGNIMVYNDWTQEDPPLNAWALNHMTLDTEFPVGNVLEITVDGHGAFQNGVHDPLVVLAHVNLAHVKRDFKWRKKKRYLILDEDEIE